MKTFGYVVLSIGLFALGVNQSMAVNLDLGQEAVDEVFFEREIESGLTRDIEAYLGHNRFIIGVDFKFTAEGTPGNQDGVVIREITTPLPGLPKASETFTKELTKEELSSLEENLFLNDQIGSRGRGSLVDGQTGNSFTGTGTEVFLVLDTTVNSVQENFIRELIARKLALDVAGGDSVEVVRSTFNNESAVQGQLSQPQSVQQPQVQQQLQPQFIPSPYPVQLPQQAQQQPAGAGEEEQQLSDDAPVIPTAEEIAAAVVALGGQDEEVSEVGFLEENLALVAIVAGVFFILLLLMLFLTLRRTPAYPPMPYYPGVPSQQPAVATAAPETSGSSSATSVDTESKQVRNAIGEVRREIASIGLSSPESSRSEMESLLAQGRMDIVAPVYKVLGEDVFESLFGTISPSQSSEIGEYLVEREISDTQLEAQSKEFYSRLVRAASESVHGNRSQAFKFLDKLHLSQILFLVKGEKTRIQALVISQLQSKIASSVLQSLESKQRSEIIHELAQFETFPVETFRDVAALLAKKASKLPAVENVHTDGIGILMSLLDSMNSVEEGKVLSDLEVKDPELHQKLRSQYFTFSDLARAPQKVMGEAMLDIDKSSMAAALTGANENVTRRVLGSMPKRLADAVKEEMNLLKGRLDDEQIQSGRKILVTRMRELVREGKIEMEKI